MKDNVVYFPKLIENYLSEAEQILQEGQLEKAEELVEEVLRISPKNIQAIYLYVVIQLQAERYVEIVDWIEEQRKAGVITSSWEEPFQLLYDVAQEELQKNIDSIQPVDQGTLEKWRQGLFSNAENQWKVLEQIQYLKATEVQQLIQEFLVDETRDAFIKTKLLQKVKEEYLRLFSRRASAKKNKPLMMNVKKEGQEKMVDVMDVPLDLLEWSDEELAPWKELQNTLDKEPSLVFMAQEMWLYFLEKKYPFHARDGSLSQWTAILHCYTLKLMLGEDWSKASFEQTYKLYEVEPEMLEEGLRQFEAMLMSNNEGKG